MKKTGEGQWVHTSLLEAMLCKLDFQGARYTMNGEVPGQEGNNHPYMSPMGVFDTSDGKINLAASSAKMFKAVLDALGMPGVAEDERFSTHGGRLKHRHELWALINEETSKKTTKDLVEMMNNEAGCPCGPIYNIDEAFEDEHAKSLRMTRVAHHDRLGDINLIRSPINMTAFKRSDEFDRPGPDAGQHSEEILIEMGLTSGEIETLRNQGVI